jgi:predicted anti-sigma-YlaC factor YlaD
MPDSSHVEHGYACSEVVELVSEYLEGAMTPEQMTRFELHLNLCDGCFSFVEQVRTTATMAGRLSEDQIPDEMKSKLLTAFRDWGRD